MVATLHLLEVKIQIVEFDRVTSNLTVVATALSFGNGGSIFTAIEWSPDGTYLAIGGSEIIGGYQGYAFQIFIGLSAGFAPGDAPGFHDLRFVAIGPSGAAGTQVDLPVCIDSRIPDNGHACTPSIAPPAAVFTLQWDSNFDLDLHVITPDGVDFNPKMTLGEPLEAGVTSVPKGHPFIDRDSQRNCVSAGLHQEDLIFPDPLPKGRYDIFADPFSACGQNAVHFTFTIYESSGTCPACDLHAVTAPKSGELLASQVTGGTAPPLFVDELIVQ